MDDLDIQLLGHRLLERGFKTYFLFMFKKIEGMPFILEKMHEDLFEVFDLIEKQINKRQVINVPPRSAKTTCLIYFISYCYAKNLKCNFIYTSFSQDLLTDNARRLETIMTSKIYQDMFMSNIENVETIQDDIEDDFWKQYYHLNEDNKDRFTAKLVKTRAGGTCLFNSIGSAITGYGCLGDETLIWTEKGYLKLGDIVKNKANIKVYSYNFNKNKVELDEITRYIENPEQNFIEITLDNGEKIKATTDHIFYLNNRMEVVARDLKLGDCLMSNIENRKIINIVNCNHTKSYCLTIKNNNNFFVSKSQVLVHNCGVMGAKSFSGLLICFPYEALIKTNKGYLKIGDIVENKLNVKVYSYNFKTNKIELKPIDNFIKHKNQELVEINLSNGDTIKCTPNHKIYTTNRGWIEAGNLLNGDCIKSFSNSFYLCYRITGFFNYIFSRIISISNKIKNIFI